jgi:hypothetical protein
MLTTREKLARGQTIEGSDLHMLTVHRHQDSSDMGFYRVFLITFAVSSFASGFGVLMAVLVGR